MSSLPSLLTSGLGGGDGDAGGEDDGVDLDTLFRMIDTDESGTLEQKSIKVVE
eukprot:gene11521-17830_t